MPWIPTRKFGPTGMDFTLVGLGTWNMERDQDPVRALRRGIEAGANHIDTAEMYGDGRVERIVARAVRGIRGEVRLVSKVLPSNASYEGTIKACERSLKNLGTDRLDAYLLHWRGRHPLEETLAAFERLKRDGKILAYGVSNFDARDLEEAVKIAGPGKIACDQVLYHMRERAVEFDLLPCCLRHGVALVAYSPLGQGRLAGEKALEAIPGATAAQAALRFLVRRESVFAIPKSSDPGRCAENVRAALRPLSAEQASMLDKAFAARRRKSLPML
jgi:diketogulonate reductase-like aldo/keto reductase